MDQEAIRTPHSVEKSTAGLGVGPATEVGRVSGALELWIQLCLLDGGGHISTSAVGEQAYVPSMNMVCVLHSPRTSL